jgi:hypothetical protein
VPQYPASVCAFIQLLPAGADGDGVHIFIKAHRQLHQLIGARLELEDVGGLAGGLAHSSVDVARSVYSEARALSGSPEPGQRLNHWLILCLHRFGWQIAAYI